MTSLLVALGLLVLLLLALDVFITVFTPEGHGGPLTRLQARTVWSAWKRMAPRPQQKADLWLSLGGPVLAVLAPATWALLLIVGFGLLFHPWIGEFLVSPGALRTRWLETLYYSGFSASTLGVGDVVADPPVLRLLTVVEALCGFALLSASLSYILAIYRENGRKQTLASELALRYELRAPSDTGPGQGRDQWLEYVARELLHITNAHAQYPILHFFRPRDPSGSLALQLSPLMPPASSERDAESPPLRGEALVAGAVDRYLAAAARRFIPDHIEAPDDERDSRHVRLLRYLGYDEDRAADR